MTHPFPIVLTLVGTAAGLAGWVAGKATWKRYGILSLLLAGIFALPAFVTGLTAADVVEDRLFVRETLLGQHRVWGIVAMVVLATQSTFATFSLLQPDDDRLRRFVFLVGIASSAVVSYAAFVGGGIVHGTDEAAARGVPSPTVWASDGPAAPSPAARAGEAPSPAASPTSPAPTAATLPPPPLERPRLETPDPRRP